MTTPRLEEDADAATTHCDATRAWSSTAPERGAALSPWKAGNEVALVVEFELDCDFCNERVVKLAETAEIDAAAAIGNLLELRRRRN